MAAGQRREIAQAFLAGDALRAKYLQQGRTRAIVFEFDIHYCKQAIPLARLRAADNVRARNDIIAGQAAALVHLPVRLRYRAAGTKMRHRDASPIHGA